MKPWAYLILTVMLCGTTLLLYPRWNHDISYSQYWITIQFLGSFLCSSSIGLIFMFAYETGLDNNLKNRFSHRRTPSTEKNRDFRMKQKGII